MLWPGVVGSNGFGLVGPMLALAKGVSAGLGAGWVDLIILGSFA